MKKSIILLLFTIANLCSAQNLVPNPSLEEFYNCPNDFSQIQFANQWSAGCVYGISTDYFNSCMLVDPNLFIFFKQPLTQLKPSTGNAEAGLLLLLQSNTTTTQIREALSSKLKSRLIVNSCYKVSFKIRFYGYYLYWIDIDNLNYPTDRISALLSPDSTIYPTPGFTDLYQLHPQINYHGPVLNDTTTWVKIEGDFIAQGNEQWIHITSFVPDDSVTVYMLPSLLNQVDSSYMPSYYLIDDVAVYPCDAPVYVANAGNDTCIKPGSSVTIGSAGHSEYLYWWFDEHGNLVDTSAQITVNPTQTTTYTLVQKDFKFDETRDTVTVAVDAHCYEVVIPDIKIPNVISPNGDGINDKFVIENGKYYNIKLIIFNRWGNQIFESNDYQNNWPASDIADGVYFYILTSTNPKQEVKEYKGSVSVVR